eukprot:196283-Chlamydomonas_euryale.AAC.2
MCSGEARQPRELGGNQVRRGTGVGRDEAVCKPVGAGVSQFTYGVKMTGVAVKTGLLTGGSRPPRQKPSHS